MPQDSPGRPPRLPGSRARLRLRVSDADQHWHHVSVFERVRRDVRNGWKGLAVSGAFHAVVLLVLAVIVYQIRSTRDLDPILIGWVPPGSLSSPGDITSERVPVQLWDLSRPAADNAPKVAAAASAGGTTEETGLAPTFIPLRGLLDGRDPTLRESAEKNDPKVAAAERAVEAGLAWLARHQLSDGRWQLHEGYPDASLSTLRTDAGATALALLAFLGAGQTHERGTHREVVDRGLKWLIGQQDPETGDLHDIRFDQGRYTTFYAHATGTLVLAEALAMTGDETLRAPLERAVSHLLNAQHPKFGGWRYRPMTPLMEADTSVTGLALVALHSARLAGVEVSLDDFARASGFLDRVQQDGGARYRYQPSSPADSATSAVTSQALLGRLWMGWPANHPSLRRGEELLLASEGQPEWANGHRNVVAWLFVAEFLNQYDQAAFAKWFPKVRDLVVSQQASRGSADIRGSWHPTQPRGTVEEFADNAGRLYITCLCVLLLETPYRHAPSTVVR